MNVDEAIDAAVEQYRTWITQMVTQMVTQACDLASAQQAQVFERAFREGGQRQLARGFETLMQAAAAGGDGGRTCPHCRARRRHKGHRPRKMLTSLGEVAIDGVCWQCPPPQRGGCGRHEHASQRLMPEPRTTGPMTELICLLGLSGSFAHASLACGKLLGVRLSTPTIAGMCEEAGRLIEADDQAAKPRRLVEGTLVGSTDGMMVHTREQGWKEMRAWRFDDDRGRRASGAALEDAQTFTPRLRQAALDQHADQVASFVFVSDAAEWIRQGVAEHLPEAGEHVVDIYHAYQHIHTAARQVHGEGTPKAAAWARRWCDELYTRGGQAVWDRLRRARFKHPEKQEALDPLLGFLRRHKNRMDYPRLRRENLPISSGPMESTCKQLGQRLKGPGMRWRSDNLTPMAHLVSLWNDQRWDTYWQKAA